jgi:hypothetical protein
MTSFKAEVGASVTRASQLIVAVVVAEDEAELVDDKKLEDEITDVLTVEYDE